MIFTLKKEMAKSDVCNVAPVTADELFDVHKMVTHATTLTHDGLHEEDYTESDVWTLSGLEGGEA